MVPLCRFAWFACRFSAPPSAPFFLLAVLTLSFISRIFHEDRRNEWPRGFQPRADEMRFGTFPSRYRKSHSRDPPQLLPASSLVGVRRGANALLDGPVGPRDNGREGGAMLRHASGAQRNRNAGRGAVSAAPRLENVEVNSGHNSAARGAAGSAISMDALGTS